MTDRARANPKISYELNSTVQEINGTENTLEQQLKKISDRLKIVLNESKKKNKTTFERETNKIILLSLFPLSDYSTLLKILCIIE